MTMTMQEATVAHKAAVAKNRNLPPVRAHNAQKQTGRTFEVESGFLHITDKDGKRRKVGPGQRFEATESQVRDLGGGRTPLTNKAVEVSAASGGRVSVQGADIGLRALMPQGLAKLAIEAGLTEDHFANITPEGEGGKFTRSQVEAVISAAQVQN